MYLLKGQIKWREDWPFFDRYLDWCLHDDALALEVSTSTWLEFSILIGFYSKARRRNFDKGLTNFRSQNSRHTTRPAKLSTQIFVFRQDSRLHKENRSRFSSQWFVSHKLTDLSDQLGDTDKIAFSLVYTRQKFSWTIHPLFSLWRHGGQEGKILGKTPTKWDIPIFSLKLHSNFSSSTERIWKRLILWWQQR